MTNERKYWLELMLKIADPVLAGLAENYINVGSLYLCSAAFLPLGLPSTHPFWADADEPWTSQKIWTGVDMPVDKHI